MTFKYIIILLFIIPRYFQQPNNPCREIIYNSKNESEITLKLSKNFDLYKNYSTSCIEQLLQNSLYTSLDYYVTELNKNNIHFRETLSTSINTLSKTLEALNNKYKYAETDYQVVSPAFQWAQNMNQIFIEVKFAHRIDSPGCLEIEKLSHEINKNFFHLEGYCVLGDFPIKFELNLNLYDEIISEGSTMNSGSVGRYQLYLKKREAKYWERLLFDKNQVISNMKVWFEMKNKYDSEIGMFENNKNEDEDEKSFEDIERELKEEKKIRKKKKKSKKKRKNEKKTEL